jgi:putative heme iron utilization protein
MNLNIRSNAEDVLFALKDCVPQGAAIFGITNFLEWKGNAGVADANNIQQITYIQAAARKAKRNLKARIKARENRSKL